MNVTEQPAPQPTDPAPGAFVEPPSSPQPSSPTPSRPSFLFFGGVAAVSLLADVTSKAWAELVLTKRTLVDPAIVLVNNHLSLTLAYNRGGAWGLFQNEREIVRRPFFLMVSCVAILFIVSLYGKLVSGQRALRWGLPLVLGGALGNLSDRIIRSSVIDFVDYRADWVESMNHAIAKIFPLWGITDHWPTFNVADISICVGVGLMALDMLLSKRERRLSAPPPPNGRLPPSEPILSASSGPNEPPVP
ncbi:MAG TPA: signal peptidase II [Polyangiaceae bacterium]